MLYFHVDLGVGTQVKLPAGLVGSPPDGGDQISQMPSQFSCGSFSGYLFGVRGVCGGVMYGGTAGKELLFVGKRMW